jgi:hypothetical protein
LSAINGSGLTTLPPCRMSKTKITAA